MLRTRPSPSARSSKSSAVSNLHSPERNASGGASLGDANAFADFVRRRSSASPPPSLVQGPPPPVAVTAGASQQQREAAPASAAVILTPPPGAPLQIGGAPSPAHASLAHAAVQELTLRRQQSEEREAIALTAADNLNELAAVASDQIAALTASAAASADVGSAERGEVDEEEGEADATAPSHSLPLQSQPHTPERPSPQRLPSAGGLGSGPAAAVEISPSKVDTAAEEAAARQRLALVRGGPPSTAASSSSAPPPPPAMLTKAGTSLILQAPVLNTYYSKERVVPIPAIMPVVPPPPSLSKTATLSPELQKVLQQGSEGAESSGRLPTEAERRPSLLGLPPISPADLKSKIHSLTSPAAAAAASNSASRLSGSDSRSELLATQAVEEVKRRQSLSKPIDWANLERPKWQDQVASTPGSSHRDSYLGGSEGGGVRRRQRSRRAWLFLRSVATRSRRWEAR